MPTRPLSKGSGAKPVTELLDLDVLELSLVPSGANGKRYLLFKSADAEEGGYMEAEIVQKILETPFDEEGLVAEGIQKAAPDIPTDALEAAVGMVKLAKTFQDELPEDILSTVGELAGYSVEKGKLPPALAAANAARAGKPEEGSPAEEEAETGTEEEEEMAQEKTKKVKKEQEGGEHMEDSQTPAETDKVVEKVEEKIEKASDIANLPENIRGPVEALFKEAAEAKEAVRKMQDENLNKEFIKKSAEELSWLPKDEDFAMTLKALYQSVPEELYQKVEKAFIAANNALGESELFVEKGTSRSGENTPVGKVEAAANELIQKSEGMTKEQAIAEALRQNPALYDEYREATPMVGGRGR